MWLNSPTHISHYYRYVCVSVHPNKLSRPSSTLEPVRLDRTTNQQLTPHHISRTHDDAAASALAPTLLELIAYVSQRRNLSSRDAAKEEDDNSLVTLALTSIEQL